MRVLFLICLIIFGVGSFAQLNQKRIEKKEGVYVYSYHKNGKLSTEEFHNAASDYMSPGYAKAFNNNGKEIYHQSTSRTGLLSSVRFSYYENGAVKRAEYSSHPDAGIQWYEKITDFDENGLITSEIEMSDDMWATKIYLPDTAYLRVEKEREAREKFKQEEKLKQQHDQFIKDSTAFYLNSKTEMEDGSVVEYVSDPIAGIRQQIISKSGKVVQITIEFYIKSNGVHTIRRTYFKNGRIHEEFIYEAQIWHYREFDKKGNLIQEILNRSIAHSE